MPHSLGNLGLNWGRGVPAARIGSWRILLLPGFDHEVNKDRKQGDTCEHAKDDIECDVAVPQCAECPPARRAAAAVDHWHDAITGDAPFGPADLAEEGYAVTVETSPAGS